MIRRLLLALLFVGVSAAPVLAANVPLSSLSAAAAMGATNEFPICQGATVCSGTSLVYGTLTQLQTFLTGTSGAHFGLLNGDLTFGGTNTITTEKLTSDVQSGTTYTFVAGDCGKVVVFTAGTAVTATIPASIVPASGTICKFSVLQAGAGKVSVNGSAVSPATLISSHSYVATNGTAGSIIDLTLTTVSAATNAYLSGDGS